MNYRFQIVLLFTLTFSFLTHLEGQDDDVYMIKKIHDEALGKGKAYPWLTDLCTKHGERIAGSPAYLGAANYTKDILAGIKGVQSYHQPCEASYWKRGAKEQVKIIGEKRKKYQIERLVIGEFCCDTHRRYHCRSYRSAKSG
jgi:hypothetical protein